MLKTLAPTALTVASAVLYGLAFPPWNAWPLAWIALVPFLMAIRAQSHPRVLLLGWLWTMALSLTVIRWFGAGAAAYFGQSPLFGLALFVIVPTLTGAIDYMAFAASYRAFAPISPAVRPFLAGAAWVAAELGRTTLLFGNPWALLGYSQLDAGPLAQMVDVTGVSGPSFVVVTVNAALAELLRARHGDSAERASARRGGFLAAGATVAALVLGAWRSSIVPAATGQARPVAVVQANVDVGTQWRSEMYGQTLDTYLELTADVLRRAAPAVVFWPENAMTFFVESTAPYAAAIARVLTRTGAELLAGGPKQIGEERDDYHNSAYLMRPGGEIAGRYDKQYLIPFAERFPMIRSDALLERFARVREFTPGSPVPPLETSAGRAGVLICNEGLFAEPARDHLRAGAEYLVILANDGWTDDAQYGRSAVAYARIRAIESRRWVVRSSTSGPSAIVDPWGRVREATAPFTRDVLVGQVTPRSHLTPYARFGDVFAMACLAATLAGVGWAAWRERSVRSCRL